MSTPIPAQLQAQPVNEVIYIVYRAFPPGTYSEDERIRRAAKNTPIKWIVESMEERYPNETEETFQARMAERIRYQDCKDNGPNVTRPEYEFKLFVGQEHAYNRSANWQRQENTKFTDGIYQHVPWVSEFWAQLLYHLHYPHLSMKQPGKIAYTQSPAHGESDRQTIISPGKYLLRHFAAWLNQAAVDAYCAEVDIFTKHMETPLQLAKTSDEIVSVYRSGPSSCMSKDRNDNEYRTGGIHPVSVYGAGDLAVAYFKDNEVIKARCIVWPAKHLHGRIYGDEARLKLLLSRDGYKNSQHGSDWDGAKLLKQRVPGGSGFVCPYLDIGGQNVNIESQYIVIAHDGDHTADNVSSVIDGSGTQNEDEDEDQFTCDICGGGYHNDNQFTSPDGDASLCESCFREMYFYCDKCETDCARDDYNRVETHHRGSLAVCDECINDGAATQCGYCEKWFASNQWRDQRSTIVVPMVRSIDEDVVFCPLCIDKAKENGRLIKRACGHYAIVAPIANHDVCFCGAPEIVPVVKTVIRKHKVGAAL